MTRQSEVLGLSTTAGLLYWKPCPSRKGARGPGSGKDEINVEVRTERGCCLNASVQGRAGRQECESDIKAGREKISRYHGPD
jgi:hypothetical protein